MLHRVEVLAPISEIFISVQPGCVKEIALMKEGVELFMGLDLPAKVGQ